GWCSASCVAPQPRRSPGSPRQPGSDTRHSSRTASALVFPTLFAERTAAVAGAASPAGLRSSTLEQNGFGPVLTNAFGGANVVVVLSINGAGSTGPFNWASTSWAQTLNWNKWFAISAAVAEPTSGY